MRRVSEPLQPFQTVRDVLRRLRTMHEEARQHFAAAAQDSASRRRKAVLEFLAGCEEEMVTGLRRYEQGNDQTLDEYVQSMPVAAFEAAAANVDASGELDAALDAYRRRGGFVARLYEQLEGMVGPRAKAVFADLGALDVRCQQRLQQALLDF